MEWIAQLGFVAHDVRHRRDHERQHAAVCVLIDKFTGLVLLQNKWRPLRQVRDSTQAARAELRPVSFSRIIAMSSWPRLLLPLRCRTDDFGLALRRC